MMMTTMMFMMMSMMTMIKVMTMMIMTSQDQDVVVDIRRWRESNITQHINERKGSTLPTESSWEHYVTAFAGGTPLCKIGPGAKSCRLEERTPILHHSREDMMGIWSPAGRKRVRSPHYIAPIHEENRISPHDFRELS